jgi:hypothetical protein
MFFHFISPWPYVSLPAWANVSAISFLPSPIFHC